MGKRSVRKRKKGGKKKTQGRKLSKKVGVPTEGTVSRQEGGPFKLSPTRNLVEPDPPGPTMDSDVDHILVPKELRVDSVNIHF